MAKIAENIRSNPIVKYLADAFEEFGKVTWPTNEQTLLLTAVTIVVTALLAIFITVVDLGLSEIYQLSL